MDDLQLLREYIAGGSEEAFAELVNRHIGLVYSAALRQMGETHWAEDVSQAVFIALAQNARRIGRGEVLSAWLLAVTRRVAAMTWRREARRRDRERKAAEMARQANGQSDAGQWDEIAPHLDEAVCELPEESRAAVVLRYFEGLSTENLAQRLKISPEAARQRLSRSVERLRGILARRGIVVSAVALSALMTAHAVQAAPVGLAAAAAAVATLCAAATGAAGASAAGLLTGKAVAAIMTWTRAKIAVIAMGLLLVGAAAAVVIPRVVGGDRKLIVVQPKGGVTGQSALLPDAGKGPDGMVGRQALSAPIRPPDGKELKLADFRGRHVLLHTWPHPATQPPGDRKGNLAMIWERFGGEEGFAMIGIAPRKVMGYTTLGNSLIPIPPMELASRPTPWPQGDGNRGDDESEKYLRAQACYVIDPKGTVALSVFDPREAYGELDRRLSRGCVAASPIRVLVRRKSLAEASIGYDFDDIPPVVRDDAARDAKLSIIDGGPGMGRNVAVLIDGRGALGDDDSANSFHLCGLAIYAAAESA